MVGHTPQPNGPRKAGKFPLVNIDVGAKQGQASVAVSEDGEAWETHVYRKKLKV